LPITISFVCCQIHFGNFFKKIKIYTIVVLLVKEAKLVIMVDDLDFGIRDVVFEAKVFNRYGTLI